VKLSWSPLADKQVDEAMAYIAADDAVAALRWLEELLERVASLRHFPDSGHVVPELERKEVRELIVGSYRVLYRRGERPRRDRGDPPPGSALRRKRVPPVGCV
jgi:plasmid stabilization system protein ParE